MPIRPVVIVPIYKAEENEIGKASLKQLYKQLDGSNIQVIFVIKESLRGIACKGCANIYFDDYFFKDLKTYSQLFNSSMFWSKFKGYTHGLIYQPDCWMYGDYKELEFWCKMGYAFIGSPHFGGYDWEKNPNELIPNSMNGGFSLRCISTHFELAYHMEKTVTNYSNIETHEDVHWCGCLSLFGFRMPDPLTAARFSWEHGAKTLYNAIDRVKPLGLHNPWKYVNHYPEELKEFII